MDVPVLTVARPRIDDRPLQEQLAATGVDADLDEVAGMLADEVRRQLGEQARTRLVVRDVLPVD